MKTLKDAKVGHTVKVLKITGEGPVKRRIMDMGITKGVEIYVRRLAPLGDPIELSLRGYELSLRKADAAMIEVEESDPAGREPAAPADDGKTQKRQGDLLTHKNIALAGNPNSGKTTIFNTLTGSNQYVGNWPGVTVEKKEGQLKKHEGITVTDLPGIYSLSPYTPEEIVARNYLIDERPDVILNIVDGTNLERNLYLTTQLTELGIPVVIAVNMMDVVEKNGDRIDTEELSKRLGCRVVVMSALKENGVMEAAEVALGVTMGEKTVPRHVFSGTVEHALAHIEEVTVHNLPEEQQRWYAIKLFERDERILEKLNLSSEIREHIEKDIKTAEAEMDDDAESIITNERYIYISSVIKTCYEKKNDGKLSVSDRIDRVVTHRIFGLPVFAAIMLIVYWTAMSGPGAYASGWVNEKILGGGSYCLLRLLDALRVSYEGTGAVLRGLLIDGMLAGVGAVLSFLPQMAVLFLMLSILEACGYMSRIAFVLDRLFRKFGLSGKSFIPILVGTGCGVPGIMASRTIESERDRRMTIITTTFIPCGAKIPFIGLMAGAIFGGSAVVSTSAYFIGMAAIIVSGIMLKKTKGFAGGDAPFVMELPPYHMPTAKSIFLSTWERVSSFVKKAGTIILLSTIVIWFASNFGFTDSGVRMLSKDEIEASFLALLGNLIAWMFAPLGWGSWQAVVASIAGLAGKENIVGTMTILYGGDAAAYKNLKLAFTPLAAYSFLVFNLLCAPCFAAIGAIRREMNSARWTWFAILYQTGFAYAVSLMIFQFGGVFTGNINRGGLIPAAVIFVFLIFMLLVPSKKEMKEPAINPDVNGRPPCDHNCGSCHK
ncbi:MAG: ferrous iron transport protein B [Lachnospiraceae bacterium]|nr:ferrous iron transport protein B [Lachnospiraceae bacterium]